LNIISDQEKGLLVTILLNVEHKVCIRHFWKSLKKYYPGDFFEQKTWDATRAFSLTKLRRHMQALRIVSNTNILTIDWEGQVCLV